jgi:excisionase family DNA binding protein
MEKMLLNPIEAATALSISRSKLYELMAAGRIGSVRIDGCRRVPVRALQDYVDRLTQENGEDLSAA